MSTTKVSTNEVLEYIESAPMSELIMLNQAIVTQVKHKRQMASVALRGTLSPGDRVRIGPGIKPQYLIGMTGVVESFSGSAGLWIKLDRGPYRKFRDGTVRFRSASCVEKLED